MCHTGIYNTDIGTSVITGRTVAIVKEAHDFELDLRIGGLEKVRMPRLKVLNLRFMK